MKNITTKQIKELADFIAQLLADEDINYPSGFAVLDWALKYSDIDKKKLHKYLDKRWSYYHELNKFIYK